MVCSLEIVALTKREKAKLDARLFSLGVSRMDRIRNEHIRLSDLETKLER